MGNAWAVWLNEVFCFSPFFVGAVSAAGDGFLYCFKEHYGHAFLFTGFRNLRGFFKTVTQRTDCIIPASTFIVPVGCLLLLPQVRFSLQLFSQFILPKIVNKIIEVISAIKEKKEGGRKEEEDGN